MHRHLNRLSTILVRAGLLATLFVMGAALTPREAEASKVCAPNGRGCYYTRAKCGDVYLPAGWTCSALAANPRTGDVITRERDGRAVALVNGQRIYVLSDTLEAQLTRDRPSAERFAQLVLTDRGSVSEESLQQVSKDLGIPIRSRSRNRDSAEPVTGQP